MNSLSDELFDDGFDEVVGGVTVSSLLSHSFLNDSYYGEIFTRE